MDLPILLRPDFLQAQVLGEDGQEQASTWATRRWPSKTMRIPSGLFCGSIYRVLPVSGWFPVPKPLSQKPGSTFLPLQDTDPTPSFGGFGLN